MISNAWTCRPGPQGGCSAFGFQTQVHTHKKNRLSTNSSCRLLQGSVRAAFSFLSFYCVREILGRLGRDKATHNPKNRCRSRTKQGPRPVSSVVGLRRRILQTISFIYISKRPFRPAMDLLLYIYYSFFQIIIRLIFLTLSLTTCLIQKKIVQT